MSKHKHESLHPEQADKQSATPSQESGTAMTVGESAPVQESQIAGETEAVKSPADTGMDALKQELEKTKAELAAVRTQLDEVNDKFLRKLAEEVNFRKRMIREKEDAQKYGITSLLNDLIPILDDFDRSIASAEVGKTYEHLHDGVLLIRRQLSQMLENKYSLKRFESKGTAFDPNRHEALFAEPGDVEEPVVSEEYLPGYELHDRILRTAKVRVKMPAPKNQPEANPVQAGSPDTEVQTPEADASDTSRSENSESETAKSQA